MATSNRLRDLRKLISEKNNEHQRKQIASHQTLNLINNWIQRNYSDLVYSICWNFNVIREGGECAFDYLNNCIINMYNDPSLQFRDQRECDIYMEKELDCKRFVTKIKVI